MKNADSLDKLVPNLHLRRERELRGWSQKDVADHLNTNTFTVSRWERREAVPSPHFRQLLCELFGKNAEELGLIREDTRPDSPPLSPHPLEAAPNKSRSESVIGIPVVDQPGPEEPGWKGISSPYDRIQPLQRNASPLQRMSVIASVVLFTLAMLVGFSVYTSVARYVNVPGHVKPGGGWITPLNGQTVGKVVHFAAYAYPTHSGEPLIDHVNFTAWWQGADPRKWEIVCVATPPAPNDVFSCNADLSLLGVVAGQIHISFDVYDRTGNANLAPNGEHTIIYSP
jgi:transcriptional regulator with XRE-family HTH domain